MIKKNKYLIFTILITILMICIVFISNGVYPFGSNIFSCGDFDHAYIPVYYKLWDVFHGVSSMFFDWNLGVGLNCFGSLIGNSLISPTSWIIGIFNREYIPYAMSFIIIIKLIEVSVITYIAIDKLFSKVDDFYKMIFTITYTFCGWTVFMLSSFLYMDVFALFPLFVLAYYRLLKDNKWLMYLIVLTICLMLNYYMSYMILFFIISMGIVSLSVLDIKDKRKKAVEILLLTLLSLGISCIVVLPALNLALTSTRMAGASEFDASAFSLGETLLKVIYILPMSVSFYFTFKQLKNKKDKKANLFIILLLILLLSGIIIPKINAMWHTGSYSGLPFRYSFIPSFVLICISLYYLENNKEKKIKDNSIINFIMALIVSVLILVFAYIFRKEYLYDKFIYDIKRYSQFICIFLLFVFSIFNIKIIMKCKDDYRKIALLVFSITYLSIFSLYFIRVDKNDNYSVITQNIESNLKLPKDNYNYLIDVDLNINSPYILKVPSIENRIHFINKEMVDFSNNLGYEKVDTLIFGKGGNLFTNLLKQNKYIITKDEMNNKLYNKIDSYKDYYLYGSKYNLNYIIPYNGEIYNKNEMFMDKNTNGIYKAIFEKDKDIMHEIEDSEVTLLPNNIYYFETTLEDNEELINKIYKVSNKYSIINNDELNIITVEVEKKVSFKVDTKNYEVSYINIDEFIDFVESVNKYKVDIQTNGNKRVYSFNNVDGYKSVLIPINYDTGYKIIVNGKNVKYKSNIYNMISLDVDKGKNKIVIEYIPKTLKEGIIVTIGSLALLLIVYLSNKRLKYFNNKIILNGLFIISALIGIGFILKIYLLFWL